MPVIKRKRTALRAVTFQKAHHFPPYHIWIGRETARLRARFIFSAARRESGVPFFVKIRFGYGKSS